MPNIRSNSGTLLSYSESQEVLRVGPFAYGTVQEAIDAAPVGGVIELAPGAYLETVTISKALALVCKGPPGICAIYGIHVLADDVSLWNVGAFGTGAEAFALKVGSQTVSPDRFRSFGGKFENAAVSILLQGTGDVLLEGVECAWSTNGVHFAANDDGFCTQVFIQNARFHNLTTLGVGDATNGGVVNLQLLDSIFDNDESGTPPTHYIKVDRSGDTGLISGCRFACATHEADTIALADGVLYGANITEEGISAARPD